MSQNKFRALSLAAASAIAMLGLPAPANAQAQAVSFETSRMDFNIPAQSLASALTEFSRQSQIPVLVPNTIVRGRQSVAVSGEMTPSEALARMSAGSGLRIQQTQEGGLTLIQEQTTSPTRLGAADQAVSSEEEVIVTAQKREERLQDVPVPVTATDAQTLADANDTRLQDYFSTIPGMNLTLGNRSEPFVAIRGVTTYGGNPTVAFVVDDVAYGSSTAAGGGFIAPDLDPSDLERIEVLRGPQGTLYGANSLGGLVKYVTLAPSLDQASGRLQAGLSTIENADDLGFSVRGSFNAPLGETVALRGSAFTRDDPGYIDNPTRGLSDVNGVEAHGARLALLWAPSDAFSMTLSALQQHYEREASPNTDRQPGVGDLEQSDIVNTGQTINDLQAYSANAEFSLGGVTLTSLTGYSINENENSIDFTSALGSFTQTQFGVTGTPNNELLETRKLSQEFRLAGALNDNIDWLLGAFYTRERSRVLADILASNPDTGQVVGVWWNSDVLNRYEESAAFGNLTFHFTDRFDVQVGARQSHDEQSFESVTSGLYNTVLLGAPSPNVTPEISAEEDAFTYLITPRFRMSEDLMLYARIATGFRAGGLNTNAGVPRTYAPDETMNYEVGAKGDAFDGRLSFDASLYYIDWRDIQVRVTQPVTFRNYNTNGSRAVSQGVELALTAHPTDGLTIETWAAFNEAELSEAFPTGSTVAGVEGDRLPFSPRLSGRLSIEQEFQLSQDIAAIIGASVNYVGDRIGQFRRSPIREHFPEYTEFNAHARLEFGDWTANAFINNLTDERGIISGGLGSFPADAYNYIQPRTVGVSIARQF